MKNKILTGVALSLLLSAGVAFAQSDTMMHKDATTGSSMMMMHPPAPMILMVNSDGTGRLRGVVSAVNGSSITVAAWGGMWTVNTTADTTVLGAASISDIKVGDYVGAMGSISEDSPTMTANIVRDWTAKHAMMQEKMMHGDSMMQGSTTKAH